MESILIKSKIESFLSKLPKGLIDFFYSNWYLLILSAVIFTSWAVNIAAIGLVFVILCACLILVIVDDVLPLIPLLFYVAFSIADTSDISKYYPLLPILIPLFAAIIFHIAFYKPKHFSLGKVGLSQLMVALVMILGGCTSISAARYIGALPYTLLIGLGVFIVYFIFYNFLKTSDNEKLCTFTAKTFMWMGIILFAEIMLYYIRNRFGVPVEEWKSEEWINLGWGIDNNVATLLLLSAPMCFYLSTKSNSILYQIIGIVQYVTIILTFSRGGILFAAITGPIIIIFTIIKSKDKQNSILFFVLTFVIALMVYLLKMDYFNTMVSNIFEDGISSNSRILLYKEALTQFSKHPLFGVGGGYDGTNYVNHVEEVVFYWFHSTFFQIIGSYGILGIFAFAFNYWCRIKVVCLNIRKDIFTLFAFLSCIGFECYSMIDTSTFVPLPNLMIVFILIAILENKQKAPLKRELMEEIYCFEE